MRVEMFERRTGPRQHQKAAAQVHVAASKSYGGRESE